MTTANKNDNITNTDSLHDVIQGQNIYRPQSCTTMYSGDIHQYLTNAIPYYFITIEPNISMVSNTSTFVSPQTSPSPRGRRQAASSPPLQAIEAVHIPLYRRKYLGSGPTTLQGDCQAKYWRNLFQRARMPSPPPLQELLPGQPLEQHLVGGLPE